MPSLDLWGMAVLVELLSAALFAGLLYFSKALPPPGDRAFWAAIWVGRAAALGYLLGPLGDSGRRPFVVYGVLELGSAVLLAWIVRRHQIRIAKEEELRHEIMREHRQQLAQADQDPLTGLMSRAALDRFLGIRSDLPGVLVVCDLNGFKAGDEILAGVGNLIRTSVRREDVAFRWGGDEFVIYFRHADFPVVDQRMKDFEKRLQAFHLRNQGACPISLSWGASAVDHRPLRTVLDEADRKMYALKRVAAPQSAKGSGD